MNRRQFLGRFFQAVISARNSNSIYGIYHPWRQYTLKANVNINLKVRVGENADGYIYSGIPYTGNEGPIMAVYDNNGAQMWCSAYYYGQNLNNSISSSIDLNGMFSPGEYTIKCLSLGAGLYLGESGQSVKFVVPDVGRGYDPQTGEYNKYNNYGYIYPPTIRVDFLFDYEGLSFNLDVVMTPLGKDIRHVEGVKHARYVYPSYESVKAEYEPYHPNDKYTWDKYLWDTGFNNNSGDLPYEVDVHEDAFKQDLYLRVYEHKGYNNKSLRGTLDVTKVTPDSVSAVGFETAFRDNNLEYDPMQAIIPDNCTGVIATEETADAVYSRYYIYNDEIRIRNTGNIIHANRYPAVGLQTNSVDGYHETITYTSISGETISAYTSHYYDETSKQEVYDTNTRVNVYVRELQFYGTTEYYRLNASGHGHNYTEWWDRSMVQVADTIEDIINFHVNYVNEHLMPSALNAYNIALSHYGDGDTSEGYWYEKRTTNGWLYKIPLDIIFGKCSGNYPVEHYTGTSSSKFTVPQSLSKEYVIFDRDDCYTNSSQIDLHESVSGSIDISGYEYCSDYSTGWWMNGIVLRQEIIPLDLDEVPHRD